MDAGGKATINFLFIWLLCNVGLNVVAPLVWDWWAFVKYDCEATFSVRVGRILHGFPPLMWILQILWMSLLFHLYEAGKR